MPSIKLHIGDCLPAMRDIPDNAYPLAIVDPPYFSGPERRGFYGSMVGARGIKRISYPANLAKWEVPSPEYFDQLFRISKHQIIWGCNHYDQIWPGPGRIVWDKCNAQSSYSDCEIAYCSMHDSTRLYRQMWNGMMQGSSVENGHVMQGNKAKNQKRIHPTEKPANLYRWLLKKYAEPGMTIFDSHCGSGSIMMACYDLEMGLDAWEKEPVHVDNAQKRFDEYIESKKKSPIISAAFRPKPTDWIQGQFFPPPA